jgi:DNA modification methylase
VWEVSTQPFSEAHFATFPPALIEPCIKAGCPAGGVVLDPFGGAGTTGLVADRLNRDAILIELNPEYAAIAERRIRGDAGMFADVTGCSVTSHNHQTQGE